MKNIFARVGLCVNVTDEEFAELRSIALNTEMSKIYGYPIYDDIDIPDWLLKRLFNEKNMLDNYIPNCVWQENLNLKSNC